MDVCHCVYHSYNVVAAYLRRSRLYQPIIFLGKPICTLGTYIHATVANLVHYSFTLHKQATESDDDYIAVATTGWYLYQVHTRCQAVLERSLQYWTNGEVRVGRS